MASSVCDYELLQEIKVKILISHFISVVATPSALFGRQTKRIAFAPETLFSFSWHQSHCIWLGSAFLPVFYYFARI